MDLVRVAGVLVVGLVLAGCAASSGGGTPRGGWTEPDRYTYVLDSQCGERTLIGRFRVTVVDGKVTDVEGLDDSAKRAVAVPTVKESVPTLGELAVLVTKAKAAGAEQADIEYDPTDGYPTRVTIDHQKHAIDDEECFTVSEYRR